MKLDIVDIHHEGFGQPRNGVYLPHYSYILGVDEWHIRSDLVSPTAPKPGGDTSTIDFNRILIGVVLTGNRQTGIPNNPSYPVTDTDIVMMREVAADARNRQWLVDNPTVKPHHDMPGSNTVCPGDNTMARWPEIVNAFQLTAPIEDDMPADKDVVAALRTKDGAWKLQYDGGIQTIDGGFYGSYFSLPDADRNDPTRRFRSIFANTDRGYSIVSTKGEVYAFNKLGG